LLRKCFVFISSFLPDDGPLASPKRVALAQLLTCYVLSLKKGTHFFIRAIL